MFQHKRSSWAVILLTFSVILLTGCGGGSGGSSASPGVDQSTVAAIGNNNSTTTPPPATGGTTGGTITPPGNGGVTPPGTGSVPPVPGGLTPPIVAPQAEVLFQFALLRGVPSPVGTMEFTGLGAGNQVLFGPISRAKAASVTLQDVPLAVTAIRLQLYNGTTLWGEGLIPVSLVENQTFVINDPDFTPIAQPSGVSVTPDSQTLFIGESIQLAAAQQFTNGGGVDDITDSATWDSTIPGVVTVSDSGLVQALSVGTTNVEAVNGAFSDVSVITVRDPSAVTGLSAQARSSSIVVGNSTQIDVTATLADTSTRDVTNSSSTAYNNLTPTLVNVSGNGSVTGLTPGSARIEVRHQGEVRTVNITVEAATLESVRLSLGANSVQVGQSTQATVTGFYNNNTSSNLTSSASLNSSNTSVASTSGSTISGDSAGQSNITASVGGFTSPTVTIQVTAAPVSSGLARLNGIRAIGGLPPVTENATYSSEAALHSRYMVKNDFIGHSEDPNNAFYSDEGDRAARNSNLSITSNVNAQLVDGIDNLMKAPFHGVGFIDPQLLSSGFGFYCENIGTFKCGTTVNVLQGRGSVPAGTTFPLTWPADGQFMPYSSYTGGEFPDPITGLGGITTPTGAPIYVQFGSGGATINVTSVTLTNNTTSSNVVVGHFDETNYTNPTPSTQSLGRNVLGSRDCLVIMASQPLTPGHQYTCSVTNNGTTTSWSFTVLNPVRRQLTRQPLELTR